MYRFKGLKTQQLRKQSSHLLKPNVILGGFRAGSPSGARMLKVQPTPSAIRFSAYEVDVRTGELRKHGIRIKLQDQPFRILQVLLEHAGEVVAREELQRQIWPSDTFVDFERGLNNAVKRLREALGDSAETPRYIETLPKRGYRFIAAINGKKNGDLTKMDGSEERVEPPMRSRGWVRVVAVAGGAVALVGILFGFNVTGLRKLVYGKSAAPRIQSLAVLPLANLSGDASQNYFIEGLTDALITELSQIGSIKVISRTSVGPYGKTDKRMPQVARELGVDGIVEGTVQRSGDRVRITAQLIYAPTDQHIWARSYERHVRDVLTLEGEVAKAIADEIEVKLTPREHARLAQTRPVNLKVLEAYLQGKHHLQKAIESGYKRGMEKTVQQEAKTAADYFQTAIREDPNYAPAYVGLAEVKDWLDPPPGDWPGTDGLLTKALSADPLLAEAYSAKGRISFYGLWDWEGAEHNFRRAIELNPNLAEAHRGYASYLDAMGRLDEGLKEYERANELDPANTYMAYAYYGRRQYERVMELERINVERHAIEYETRWRLGFAYERTGNYKEAITTWEDWMSQFDYPELAQALRRGYSAGGFQAALREWAKGLQRLSGRPDAVPYWIPYWVPAYIYADLGDKDRAFAWLEKEFEMHAGTPPGFNVDPMWDSIRSDPRFADLVHRTGLPPAASPQSH
jgi:TolB-like protein/DNA-binding winged helix-turn-helix (wHTH) protein